VGVESARPGRIAAWLARHVELALDEVGLSPAQYRVLVLLAEAADGKAVPSVLAERLAVTRPSVTAVVDGLVARGLVVRRPDEVDRRRVEHSLSAAGHAALALADTAVQARLRGLTAHAGPAAGHAAIDGLGRWQPVLDAYRAAKSAAATTARP
jgi:long-chain acyl-CoA synthetase